MEVDLTIQHKHTIKTETTKTKKAVLSTSLLRRCKEAITTGKKRKEVLFSKAFNASTPLGSQITLARKIKNKQTGKIHSKFVLSCAFLSNQLFWKAPAIQKKITARLFKLKPNGIVKMAKKSIISNIVNWKTRRFITL